MYFPYSDIETDYLKSRDKKLGAVIDSSDHIYRELRPDIFTALIHSVLGQQISTKAHDTIWNRAILTYSPITPKHLADMDLDTLRSIGISMRKAGYINEIAKSIVRNDVDLALLDKMENDEVCAVLSSLKGIGEWTAEMLMIFSLSRPDILSFKDLGIIRGMKMIYGYESVSKEVFENHKKIYSPYATTASLYLWAVSKGDIIISGSNLPPLEKTSLI